MSLKKNREIEAISQFVQSHPESTVSRRITRELLGDPFLSLGFSPQDFQEKLAASDEQTIESYYILVL